MKTTYRSSFERDLKRIKDTDLLAQIEEVITQVKQAARLDEIGQLKKIAGYDRFYRIRVGSYRIGIEVRGATVEFLRCLSRHLIYRFFP